VLIDKYKKIQIMEQINKNFSFFFSLFISFKAKLWRKSIKI